MQFSATIQVRTCVVWIPNFDDDIFEQNFGKCKSVEYQ